MTKLKEEQLNTRAEWMLTLSKDGYEYAEIGRMLEAHGFDKNLTRQRVSAIFKSKRMAKIKEEK